eukprot:6135186-Pyramimonas_sp.AAC.1
MMATLLIALSYGGCKHGTMQCYVANSGNHLFIFYVAEEVLAQQKVPHDNELWELIVLPLANLRLEQGGGTGAITTDHDEQPLPLHVWNRLSIVEWRGTHVAFEIGEMHLSGCASARV